MAKSQSDGQGAYFHPDERSIWDEAILKLFAEADVEFKNNSKSRIKSRWNRLGVGIVFLFLAAVCVISLYGGLPKLLLGAASNTQKELNEIQSIVNSAEAGISTSVRVLKDAGDTVQKSVNEITAKISTAAIDKQAEITAALQQINTSLSELENGRRSPNKWSGLNQILAAREDLETLLAVIPKELPKQGPADADTVTPQQSVAVTPKVKFAIEQLVAQRSLLESLNGHLQVFQEGVKQLQPLMEAQPNQKSGLEQAKNSSLLVHQLFDSVQQGIRDQMNPAITSLIDDHSRLHDASKNVVDATNQLNDASRIGTGPVAYTVLAITAMFATFGVSSLWRWSKSFDDERTSRDRYFAAKLLAANAVMLASRPNEGTGRSDTAAILSTIERAILGIRQPKEAAAVALPAIPTTAEIVDLLRGSPKP
jgi:hypothetical protein